MDTRSRRLMRETSPDRAKVCPRPRVKPIKKVQIIYYLSRNGHLEHPHYVEVTHLAEKPLRLKDVIERLTILRGKGMPSLYSWSCKRSYKNGYVWNDLAENDTIYPSEGAEYVLKGSELIEGCSARSQEIQLSTTDKQSSHHQIITRHKLPNNAKFEQEDEEEDTRDYDEEEELEYELLDQDERKTSYSTSSTTIDQDPKTTPNQENDKHQPRSSTALLLQLIACGATAKRAVPVPRGVVATRNVPRGVLSKNSADVDEDEDMIKYISENPRFGNPQAEEKEYFSGSIVESMRSDQERRAVQNVPSRLQRSNSYNELRNTKATLEESVEEEEEEEKREKTKTTGKCIPRRKSTTTSSKNESKK